jgi:hypothetical protein
MTRFWLNLRQVKSSNLQASSRFRARIGDLPNKVCFIKENGQCGYKYPVLAKDNCYIVQKLISSKCSRFWLTTCLVEVFFNRHPTCLWDQLCSSSRRHVPLFVRGRLYAGCSREKRKEASPILQFNIHIEDDSRFIFLTEIKNVGKPETDIDV